MEVARFFLQLQCKKLRELNCEEPVSKKVAGSEGCEESFPKIVASIKCHDGQEK